MGTWRTSVVVPGSREDVVELFTDRENYRRLVAPIGATLVRAGTPLPVRHYIGVVDFHDHPSGTRVEYTSTSMRSCHCPARSSSSS